MTVGVSLHSKAKRRKRDCASAVVFLVCIGGVVWSGLATSKHRTEHFHDGETEREIPFANRNVQIAIEDAKHRRLQESYRQRESPQAITTNQQNSHAQQPARLSTIIQDASFQEHTPSLQRSHQKVSASYEIQRSTPLHQKVSAPYEIQRATPLQGGSQRLSSQQQAELRVSSQQAPQQFSPKSLSGKWKSTNQLSTVGSSHQQQQDSQVDLLVSKGRDQQQQSSSDGLRRQEIAPRLPQSQRQVRSVHAVDLERPIMYTYYEKAVTDMTDDADEDLLENWKKAWYDAGWQPTILNESDARRLPEFDALVELVVDPKHIGTYNMACYIRWIAMAAVGGGFMSDYDTFPLNHFLRHGRILPFDGELTVWAGHVPALVSGNGPEYFRIAKRIGLSMQKQVEKQKYINTHGPSDQYRNHLAWSDMLALAEIYKISTDMYIKRYEVVNAADALQVEEWTTAHCSMTNGMRAIHFSHKAMDEGKQAYRGAIHRATVARQFLNTWHKVCNYTHVAD